MAVPNKRSDQPAYRSRGEKSIGTFLRDANVPFRHEAPLLVEKKGKPKIWHPDFYLPDFHTVIEYFGVTGDPGYERMKRTKATVYRKNHIPAIFLSEPDLREGWEQSLLDDLEDIVEEREYRFRQLKRNYLGRKETISAGQTIHYIVTQGISVSKCDELFATTPPASLTQSIFP